MIDEVVEGWHQTLVEEGIDHFPVGRVPADEENLLGERSGGDRHGFQRRQTSIPGDPRLSKLNTEQLRCF